MTKKIKFFIGFIVICLVVVLIFLLTSKTSINTFKRYLVKNKEYSSSSNICTRKSEKTDELTTETYTEIYNFAEHTFSTMIVHYNNSDQTSYELEYIYNFSENVVTVNIYDTNESRDKRNPDTIFSLNNEEILDCTKGEYETNSEFYKNISRSVQEIKEVVKKELDECGLSLQDII